MPTPSDLVTIAACQDIVEQISKAALTSSRSRSPTDRATFLCGISIRLREAYRFTADHYPFETVAVCVLPDHLHAIWSLPVGDLNFPRRWGLIKSKFSRGLPSPELRSGSQIEKRDKGVWQRRYWEHAIRGGDDLSRHIDHIHYNLVKHGYVLQVQDWPHSSFHRYVKQGLLPADWGGDVQIRDVGGE